MLERFVSRGIFADLDPGSIDAVRSSCIGNLVSPDNTHCLNKSSGTLPRTSLDHFK